MAKAWTRKAHQRQISRDLEGAYTGRAWAKALCRVLLFYAERHPDAGIDVGKVREVMQALEGTWVEITIRRDKSGFTAKIGYTCYRYITIDNRGLPPIPTSYEEEHAA